MSKDDEHDAEEEDCWAPQQEGPDAHTEVGSNEEIYPFSPGKPLLHSIPHGEQESDQSAADYRNEESNECYCPHRGTIFCLPDSHEALEGDIEGNQDAAADLQPRRSVRSK
jgi:hypothetical protein